MQKQQTFHPRSPSPSEGMASKEPSGPFRKKKIKSLRARESHREIEKRRRDRMNKSLAQLRSLIPEDVAQYWEKKKLEKLDVIEMAVEHLTRIRSVSTCSNVTCSNATCSNATCSNATCSNVTCSGGTFTIGYNTCFKAVLDYFQMAPLHSTNVPGTNISNTNVSNTNVSSISVSVPHLVSYLEHRLTCEPASFFPSPSLACYQLTNPLSSGQDQITRHPSPCISHQSQARSTENQRPLSSCEYQRTEPIIRSSDHPKGRSTNLIERSDSPEKKRRPDSPEKKKRSDSPEKKIRPDSPEKRRRSDEGETNRASQATPDSLCSLSSPGPNIANLTISDTPPPPLVDLATSRSSSSATERAESEERRRSTSFKKVLKERYLGSRSE